MEGGLGRAECSITTYNSAGETDEFVCISTNFERGKASEGGSVHCRQDLTFRNWSREGKRERKEQLLPNSLFCIAGDTLHYLLPFLLLCHVMKRSPLSPSFPPPSRVYLSLPAYVGYLDSLYDHQDMIYRGSPQIALQRKGRKEGGRPRSLRLWKTSPSPLSFEWGNSGPGVGGGEEDM